MRFELARPTFEEAETVWKWRLDPEVMKQSFTFKEPLPLELFFPLYLQTHFIIKKLPPLFVWEGDKRVALLRFNRAPRAHQVEISIIVPKEARGQGLGPAILRAAALWVKEQGFCSILARIKPDNTASIKAFGKAGYVLKKETHEFFEFVLNLAPKPPNAVFVIAEVGSNWKPVNPYELIEKAAEAGADAVKFQVFRADTIYAKNAGVADYLGQDIETIFKNLEMPYEMIAKLAEACQKADVEFMASPFSPADFQAVDPFVKRHKIASYENAYIPLLKAAAMSQKPIILSTGASTLEDIVWSVDFLKLNGATDLTLMQCLAKYPAPPEEMNLRVIPAFQEQFGCPVGLSDHTADPYAAPLAAVALGAIAIEKHFTLDRGLPGPDHSFAITPNELKSLVQQIRLTEKLLGSCFKQVEPCEAELRAFARRSVQATRDIKKGELLQAGVNMALLRPGKNRAGAHPKFLEQLEGTAAQENIGAGDGISL